MDYRRMGSSDLTVSAIGFGCWELGGTNYGPIDIFVTDGYAWQMGQRAVSYQLVSIGGVALSQAPDKVQRTSHRVKPSSSGAFRENVLSLKMTLALPS